ncbi:hypothetical protein PR002_g5885 [Phytophthora rubi]|uniref:Uncharacterized protein n=1 Tax=Phytophthora rubi TaxID=129364 RepID=A0A6A3N5L5_9STRA|nr:hypothetical protein PR002_g5885 [Phytophthora rubi]
MKRIFQRRVRSPSASSPSESPTHRNAQTSLLSPRRAASAYAKGSAGRNGPELTENRAVAVAVGSDALHAQVEAFATSIHDQERQQALSYIHNALVTEFQASEGAGRLLDARETNTLVSVGGQRLRSCFSRALELFNAGRLDGNVNATFLLSTDSGERDHVLQLLQVLRVLLVKGDNAQALLLVSARIPSTLVKVTKALSDAGETDSVDELVQVILDVLVVLVTSPDVVQELNESSTLHRIFHLAFHQESVQMNVVKVVEALLQGLQQSRWRSLVKLLYEERCLGGLIHNANGVGVLAKALSVTALSLRRAFAVGLLDLHRQMNADQQRHKIMTTFTQLFEFRQKAICAENNVSTTVETSRIHDQELADAVAELCSSGNDSTLQQGNIYQNKAFKLAIASMENMVEQSLFNPEAFGLLSDILAYLHRPAKTEEGQRWNDEAYEKLMDNRQRLECHYLQKLGQIIVTCRFDYEFVSNASFLAQAIEKFDGYSEMAQHTIMSVLSAIAIEARVIPYVELASINAFIQKGTFQRLSIHALLAFIANLFRFDESYHEVLCSVGLVSTLVALFLDQTSTVCSDAGSTQIRRHIVINGRDGAVSARRTILSAYTVWFTNAGVRLHIGWKRFFSTRSILQALRYVTLAVYFPEDGEVTLAFPGNVVVLQGALAYLEALLRPKSASTMATEYGVSSEQGTWLDDVSMKEHFLGALLDCDVILSLLGIMCAVAKKWDVSVEATSTSDAVPASHLAMVLSLQSIFSLVTTSSEAERQFCSFISFGSFGDLISNFLTRADAPAAYNGILSNAASLDYFCVRYCIGFSLGDYGLVCFDKPSHAIAKQENDRIVPEVLRHPQFFGIGIQILSLHADGLGVDKARQLMNAFLRISTFSTNAHRLASANALEALLRSFTAKPASSIQHDVLLFERNSTGKC